MNENDPKRVLRLAFSRDPAPPLDLADHAGRVRCADCQHRAALGPWGGPCEPGRQHIGKRGFYARRNCGGFVAIPDPYRMLWAAACAAIDGRPEAAASLAEEAARVLRAEATRAAEAGGTP